MFLVNHKDAGNPFNQLKLHANTRINNKEMLAFVQHLAVSSVYLHTQSTLTE